MSHALKKVCAISTVVLLTAGSLAAARDGRVEISAKEIALGVRLEGGCRIDSLTVGGREVLDPQRGMFTGFMVNSTALAAQGTPTVKKDGEQTVIEGIRLADAGVEVKETWRFSVDKGSIIWTIERDLSTSCTFSEIASPGLALKSADAYDAALLDNGGSAWFRMLDAAPSALGQNMKRATYWKRGEPWCLDLAVEVPGGQTASRFARDAAGQISQTVYAGPLAPVFKHTGPHHMTRFLRGRTDMWEPATFAPGRQSVTVRLSALDAEDLYGRGDFKFVSPEMLTTIANTIARVGVIDRGLMGGNNYHTGFVCLHEQYIADLGLFINDPQYFDAYRVALDNYRDHAIEPDGRVKPRFNYAPGDHMPGSFDKNGFYECQWGWLMDSQPDFVINVCSLFDVNGDRAWLATHKAGCEKALDYLLARDSDGDGLLEMKNASCHEKVGSDWIDIVWAAHENAFVNAEMAQAMKMWSRCEALLGDEDKAAHYAARAAKLTQRFNQSIDEGGFWDPRKKLYVYWREKDDSIHGDNMVVPVNFMAIAYGICQDEGRIAAILDQIETQTANEGLFFWPLCLTSFKYEEVAQNASIMWPFPAYENGDIFLSWGDVGVLSYARTRPEIAMKYVRQVIAQYEKDGLAFQRYLRRDQKGAGDDILAGNALTFVGFYRGILGIQPKYNRLYLDPHITPEVAGSTVRYRLRGQEFRIGYGKEEWTAACGRSCVSGRGNFGVWFEEDGTAQFFAGDSEKVSARLKPARSGREGGLAVREWSPRRMAGEVQVRNGEGTLWIEGLAAGAEYRVTAAGETETRRAGSDGRLALSIPGGGQPTPFSLAREK